MDTTTLSEYRRGLYATLTHSRDALFEVSDALLSYPTARSFVELSEAGCMQRRWPSLYQALSEGQIDTAALIQLWVRHLPSPSPDETLVLGLDATSIHRPLSHTYPDRTWVHAPNLPPTSRPVRPGWEYSTLACMPQAPSSQVYWLAVDRVASTASALAVGASQLHTVLPLLPSRPVLLADSRYASSKWLEWTRHLACDQLLRTAANRVLYRKAPPPIGRRGGPRKDGDKFQGKDPETHKLPDTEWSGTDSKGKSITVSCWSGLHLRKCRDVQITAIRISRQSARDTKRDPKDSWYWWIGGQLPPLDTIPTLYSRRYSLEHAYRYDKQDMLWDKPHLRRPEQMSLWTLVVSAVHNELLLAAPQLQVEYRPWEPKGRLPTPRQVRRCIPRLLAQLGTPVRAVQPRGKSPGRAKGAPIRRAPQHLVLKKLPPSAALPPLRPVGYP